MLELAKTARSVSETAVFGVLIDDAPTSVSAMKITYFDMHGGRGEALRLTLALGGIDFEDDRISFQQFGERRASYPFFRVPVMEVDGKELTQSNTLLRLLGKRAGFYPDDPWQAALCDETMDAIEDCLHALVSTFGLKDEALKTAREKLAENPLSITLKRLNSRLESAGGEFFADKRLTVADLKSFVWVNSLQSGILDHIPTDIVSTHAPLLVAHNQRVGAHEGVKAYYAKVMPK